METESLPTESPYEVVVPYSISEVVGLDVVQEMVAAEVVTARIETSEMIGGVGAT